MLRHAKPGQARPSHLQMTVESGSADACRSRRVARWRQLCRFLSLPPYQHLNWKRDHFKPAIRVLDSVASAR